MSLPWPGYYLHERVLRAAQVGVVSAAASASDTDAAREPTARTDGFTAREDTAREDGAASAAAPAAGSASSEAGIRDAEHTAGAAGSVEGELAASTELEAGTRLGRGRDSTATRPEHGRDVSSEIEQHRAIESVLRQVTTMIGIRRWAPGFVSEHRDSLLSIVIRQSASGFVDAHCDSVMGAAMRR